MGILRVLIELFLLYILYKIIFDFIIPIYFTTKKVKKQFGEMQQKMEAKQRQQDQEYASRQNEKAAKDKADYIDYEEIK